MYLFTKHLDKDWDIALVCVDFFLVPGTRSLYFLSARTGTSVGKTVHRLYFYGRFYSIKIRSYKQQHEVHGYIRLGCSNFTSLTAAWSILLFSILIS